MIKKAAVMYCMMLLFCFCFIANAQQFDVASIKKEVQKASELESKFFVNGDCEKVVDLMADDITFHANGKKVPSKEMILTFCKKVRRPFKKPISINIDYHVLSENTAYTIRTMDLGKNQIISQKETVTKIWKKYDDGWKITHLHSTVKKVPPK
ncbi:nuclear transport factor 2 family protein [Spongiivirga sp. MCCC 1A20706]|uniref:nuclear transport factor 2 family protein n=1 Tax=Spongiivirga sp. MCCC 1A20706 TaxID=3160963 RepID=UPI003977D0D9